MENEVQEVEAKRHCGGHGIKIVAIILSLGLLLSAAVISYGIIKSKSGANVVVTVTGSAKKQIKSDLIVWRGNFNVQSPSLAEAYNMLKTSQSKTKAYLTKKGIAESEMVFSSINTMTIYQPQYNGMNSTKVEGYRLTQSVEVKSKEVDKVTTISREITELLNDGVEFESQPPQYFYTKIADVKVDMLAEATKDSKSRAEKIAETTGSKIGKLRAARVGVFQITAPFSTDVSDYGINDTMSVDKEITAVMNCDFELK